MASFGSCAKQLSIAEIDISCWSQSGEIPDPFCIVWSVQAIEAIAGDIERSLLPHDVPWSWLVRVVRAMWQVAGTGLEKFA